MRLRLDTLRSRSATSSELSAVCRGTAGCVFPETANIVQVRANIFPCRRAGNGINYQSRGGIRKIQIRPMRVLSLRREFNREERSFLRSPRYCSERGVSTAKAGRIRQSKRFGKSSELPQGSQRAKRGSFGRRNAPTTRARRPARIGIHFFFRVGEEERAAGYDPVFSVRFLFREAYFSFNHG